MPERPATLDLFLCRMRLYHTDPTGKRREMAMQDDEREIFEAMGRCLSSWNKIEERILSLLEYLHSHDGVMVPAELALGYWSIISFEARLKWAATVLEYRLQPQTGTYSELRSDWKEIKNLLKSLSSKRAEVAHGTVVWFPSQNGGLRVLLVPALQRKLTSHRMRIGTEAGRALSSVLGGLEAKELLAREDLFRVAADRIWLFQGKLNEVDTNSGRFS